MALIAMDSVLAVPRKLLLLRCQGLWLEAGLWHSNTHSVKVPLEIQAKWSMMIYENLTFFSEPKASFSDAVTFGIGGGFLVITQCF
jgi:hypothetical protein